MGKTPKPLRIVVLPPFCNAGWVLMLAQAGHDVTLLDSDHSAMPILNADLILGPTCARFLPGMEKFLESFIKGARAVKYKGKKDD